MPATFRITFFYYLVRCERSTWPTSIPLIVYERYGMSLRVRDSIMWLTFNEWHYLSLKRFWTPKWQLVASVEYNSMFLWIGCTGLYHIYVIASVSFRVRIIRILAVLALVINWDIALRFDNNWSLDGIFKLLIWVSVFYCLVLYFLFLKLVINIYCWSSYYPWRFPWHWWFCWWSIC